MWTICLIEMIDLWSPGLNGEPADPWKDTRYLHLVNPRTGADLTFRYRLLRRPPRRRQFEKQDHEYPNGLSRRSAGGQMRQRAVQDVVRHEETAGVRDPWLAQSARRFGCRRARIRNWSNSWKAHRLISTTIFLIERRRSHKHYGADRVGRRRQTTQTFKQLKQINSADSPNQPKAIAFTTGCCHAARA